MKKENQILPRRKRTSRSGLAMALAGRQNNALQSISWAIGMEEPAKGLPVVVFNPHGFAVDTLVQVNKQYSRVMDCDGNEVMSQLVHSTTLECDWRRDTLFGAHVPALGYAVYYLASGEPAVKESDVKATAWTGHRTANEHGGTILEAEAKWLSLLTQPFCLFTVLRSRFSRRRCSPLAPVRPIHPSRDASQVPAAITARAMR